MSVDENDYSDTSSEDDDIDIHFMAREGSIKDMEQYRSLVGEIQGLSFAIDELSALLKGFDTDDEDSIST